MIAISSVLNDCYIEETNPVILKRSELGAEL